MNSFASYEDWGLSFDPNPLPPVLEALRGDKIVGWYGDIERQLLSKIAKSEQNRNHAYSDKLRAFLQTWRDNEITGSINREQVDVLKAASNQLAADSWTYQNYFQNLRDSLREIIANVEQLPSPGEQNEPMAPPPSGGGGMSPPSDFGPEGEPGQTNPGENDMEQKEEETAPNQAGQPSSKLDQDVEATLQQKRG